MGKKIAVEHMYESISHMCSRGNTSDVGEKGSEQCMNSIFDTCYLVNGGWDFEGARKKNQ